ncbi:copper chaperone PCu(A)C [Pseudomaricurvus sp.]|uniref:copper chaperone PCu(A)C n=1 Tax=Pseudomaricurvus sp. TaxID=2004510 RepID=UPI003F6CB0BD
MKTVNPLYLLNLRGRWGLHQSQWARLRSLARAVCIGVLFCASIQGSSAFADRANSELSQTSVSIGDARIRLPLPGQTTAVVYLTLHNASSQQQLLTGVKVVGSDRAELHKHIHENGMMKMRKVDQIPVVAGDTLSFEPGGYHIMVFDMAVAAPALSAQRVYPVTLIFEGGQSVNADAQPVR